MLFNSENPLWLPKGSVRALLALGIVGAYIGGLLTDDTILGMVLGFYFAKAQG